MALGDGDRPADGRVAGAAHLLGLVVCVVPWHLLAVLVGNQLAALLGNIKREVHRSMTDRLCTYDVFLSKFRGYSKKQK